LTDHFQAQCRFAGAKRAVDADRPSLSRARGAQADLSNPAAGVGSIGSGAVGVAVGGHIGAGVSVADLAVVVGRPSTDLAGVVVEEAVAAGVVAGSREGLVFRHGLIRQALYEGMLASLRRLGDNEQVPPPAA
jgi:hypothetical protein